jgi:hypothetical protein
MTPASSAATTPRDLPATMLGLAVALVVATPVFVATTFIGDDHVFLAFARHVGNPLVAFVRDQHGGEFYRPLPMIAWWVLARLAHGSNLPFAIFALALHAAAGLLLGAVVVRLGRSRRVATLAALFFWLAPQNLAAAYWFSASTDQLATVFTLGALATLLRGRVGLSALLALAAYLSKESALLLPALGLLLLGASAHPPPWSRRGRSVLPHVVLALAVLAWRWRVLGGWGRSGDTRADLGAKLLQITSGLVHVGTGAPVLPEPLAWGLGASALALLALACFRRAGRRGQMVAATGSPLTVWAPLFMTALACVPLLGAGWIVGERYFYLPAAGLAWASAEALAGLGNVIPGTAVGVLLALGLLQASARRADVVEYDARVAAARRGVGEGARRGHHVFHVAGGIKDLDLAVKEDPTLAPFADDILVLGDVPASFAIVPPRLEPAASIVIASPPLPPSGAYHFGDRRVVGLARRGDDPSLDEVLARFPDLRFLRLRPVAGGRVIARDVTDELKASGDQD